MHPSWDEGVLQLGTAGTRSATSLLASFFGLVARLFSDSRERARALLGTCTRAKHSVPISPIFFFLSLPNMTLRAGLWSVQ